MPALRIGFACIAAMAFLVAIVAIEMSQGAVPSYIHGRCDGRKDPIEDIEISSCPTGNNEGCCEIQLNSTPVVKMSFTPLKDYDERIVLTVRGPQNGDASTDTLNYDPCQWGARCPLRANRTEKIELPIRDLFTLYTVGDSIFNVHTAKPLTASESIYCVNWMAAVV